MNKRIFKIAIPLVVLIGLAAWVASRWDVWFHNPDEAPQAPRFAPYHVLLTFGDSLEQSRNVSWQCDTTVRPSHLELVTVGDSLVRRIEATGEVFASRTGKAAYYVARLRQLKSGQAYRYRVVTAGRPSAWYSFTVSDAHRQRVNFLYVGDVQDTLGGQANRYLKEALRRNPSAEFVVCGGDLTERPTNQHWDETFRDIDSVGQHLPLLAVTGNHDYLKGLIMRLERRFPLVFSYFLDSKIADNLVYTLCYGPVQFFLLDSNRELPYLLTQRHWLEKQLRQSTARWKIVVLHHPLFSIKGNNNLIQRWMFNDLIERYGVDLVLQGHEHAYARMTRHTDDGRPTTPVYTVSHCSPKNYRIEFSDRFDKYGITSRYYQTISVSADTLAVAAYEVYGHTLYDSLLIVKHGGESQIIDQGRHIPEYLEYTPNPDSKKDRAFARRIEEYKKKVKSEKVKSDEW